MQPKKPWWSIFLFMDRWNERPAGCNIQLDDNCLVKQYDIDIYVGQAMARKYGWLSQRHKPARKHGHRAGNYQVVRGNNASIIPASGALLLSTFEQLVQVEPPDIGKPFCLDFSVLAGARKKNRESGHVQSETGSWHNAPYKFIGVSRGALQRP